jgi:hypothetical protein
MERHQQIIGFALAPACLLGPLLDQGSELPENRLFMFGIAVQGKHDHFYDCVFLIVLQL